MKSILNIKSIIIIALRGVLSFVFFGKSFAADTAKVAVGTANIRKTADSNSTIVEQANKGEEVQIIEKSGEWYKVKYNNKEGYIREDLLDVKAETTTENSNSDNNTSKTETENTTVEKPAEQTNTENTVSENTAAGTENTETVSTTSAKTETETVKKVEDKTGMYTCKQDTKLKIMPLINGLNIKDIKANETVNVLEVNNKWAYAESGVNRGWILVSKIDKVTAEQPQQPQQPTENQEEQQEQQETDLNTTMYVNSEVINLRKEATTDSDSLARLNKGTEVIVHSNNNGWSKVTVDGKEGYISTSLLTERKPEDITSRALDERNEIVEEQEEQEEATETEEEPTWSAPSGGSATGQAICDFARQFEGCDYVYGGTTPDGFDCSGFTQFVFGNFGYDINRTASAQAYNGEYVSRDDLQAGDLLIFNGHAGLYLGDGTFIHAENSRTGVVITDIDASYYARNYLQARRIAE